MAFGFDDDEKNGINGILGQEGFGQPFNNSNDARIGLIGLENVLSESRSRSVDEKETENYFDPILSKMESNRYTTILSEADDDAYVPLVEQMRNSVFSVRIENVMEDFIAPFRSILVEMEEASFVNERQKNFTLFSHLNNMTHWLKRIHSVTGFSLERRMGVFEFLFDRMFTSRRREEMTVIGAIDRQTEFLRTGLLRRDRGFFERIFEPQAIGRAFLSLATGFGIGRDKAQIADEKRARGEQLGVLERISAGVYRDLTFQNQVEKQQVDRDQMLFNLISNQTNELEKIFTPSLFERALTRTNEYLENISNSVSGRVIEGYFTHVSDSVSMSYANVVQTIDNRASQSTFSNPDDIEQENREISMLEWIKIQGKIIMEELPKLTDQMKESLKQGKMSGFTGAAGGVLGGLGATLGSMLMGRKGVSGKRSGGILGGLMGLGGRAGRAMTGGRGVKGFLGNVGGKLGPLSLLTGGLALAGSTQNTMEQNTQLFGGLAGSLAGAKGGALLGSFAGPIGTIVGGILGSIAGFVAGENFGKMIGGVFRKIFGKKEDEAIDAGDGLIASVYAKMTGDLEDESKSEAPSFVGILFDAGVRAMGSVWEWTKNAGAAALSFIWEKTKIAGAATGKFVWEQVEKFAAGGAKTIGNAIADSIAEYAPLVGSTIWNGIKLVVTEGIPALTSILWDAIVFTITDITPALGRLTFNILKGVADLGSTLLIRAFAGLADGAMKIQEKFVGWMAGLWDRFTDWAIGLIPDWLKPSASDIEEKITNVETKLEYRRSILDSPDLKFTGDKEDDQQRMSILQNAQADVDRLMKEKEGLEKELRSLNGGSTTPFFESGDTPDESNNITTNRSIVNTNNKTSTANDVYEEKRFMMEFNNEVNRNEEKDNSMIEALKTGNSYQETMAEQLRKMNEANTAMIEELRRMANRNNNNQQQQPQVGGNDTDPSTWINVFGMGN